MQEQVLREGLEILQKDSGFRTNNQPAYLVKSGPDNYRALIQDGFCNGPEGTELCIKLYLSCNELEGINFTEVAKQHRFYNQSISPVSYKDLVVRYPIVYNDGIMVRRDVMFTWMIEQRIPEGLRLLLNYPDSTLEEKVRVAKVYWHTAVNFPQVFETDPSEATTAQGYFMGKLREWTKIGEYIAPEVTKRRGMVQKGILNNIESLPMFWFFRLFQNTDIILADNRGYMLDFYPALKPKYFGIACWLWGWSLFWSVNNKLNQLGILNEWELEFDSWINIFFGVQLEIARISTGNLPVFEENYFRFRRLIWANFLERVYATLCVDLPLRRSPFNDINDDQVRSVQEFWLSILNNVLFKLGVS
ncbi:MAG: hypothetical protein HYW77_01470 [Parcubacteria group bacterium]|nr:hypothetical protein [Parcubacteria group bacterium]